MEFGSKKHHDQKSLTTRGPITIFSQLINSVMLIGGCISKIYVFCSRSLGKRLTNLASPTQAWLWHRRLSHLNFDYINLLSKKDVVIGLPKLKYVKDQLCSSCEVSKAKRSSFKSKTVPSSKGRLNLLHMDLCGPMRVASINGKKYILVIVDDYSRYTWTLFLRSKDETPEVLKDFLTMIQRNLQAPVISVRTDRGTEFLNKTLNAFFKEEGIEHQTSTPRTPEQNGVVERRNRTLVEAARTMLSASKLPLFFWAEAIATACYTQNRSIIIPTHEKTAYHIINDRKPSIKHLHIFGCTCYLTRDGENLDKMKEKGDPCILVGYSTQSKGYRVYNKRTRLIVESIHLRFDEIKEMSETSVANDTSGLVPQRQKASDYDNPDPAPELQNVSPSADTTSSSPTDDSAQQDTLPLMNIHPTTEPSTPTHVNAEENNNDQAEFTNPFCTPVQEIAESSSRNIDEQDMQQMLKQAKILKGGCLNGLSALKSNFTRILEQGITKSEFERAFSHIFGEDVDTFTRTFSQNMDTLEQQLTKETILESNCQNAFRVLKTQFEKIFSSVLIKPSSLDGMYARKDFHAYTSMEPQLFKEIILKNFDFIEDYMLKTIIHAQTIQKRLDDKKLQIQECTVQEVKALDAISEDKAKKSCMKSNLTRRFSEIGSMASFKVLETQFQMFIKSRMYLDDEFVVMTRNYFLTIHSNSLIIEFCDTLIQHMEYVKKSIDEGTNINEDNQDRIYDEEPMAEVQTTAEINIFATGQQHTEQPEFNNEREVDQNAEQCQWTHVICLAILTDNLQ
ncbi:retrovirus-related pol polyprotein from transposon TNT 1-94 [Tanacetum coccineum]